MNSVLIHLYQIPLGWYFAVREWWPFWSTFLNRRARALFQSHQPILDPIQTRVLYDLKESGIAVTSLEEFFRDGSLLGTLQTYARHFENTASVKNSRKEFLQHYFDLYPELDPVNPFVTLSLNKRAIDVVNSYMNMWTKLRYYTLIRTIPTKGSAVMSQRWHRDTEEKRMVKMFVYLTDVDETSGPFIYIPQSVYGKKYGHLFPQRPPGGFYPKEGEVEKLIPKEDIRAMTGKAGTLLFCDTTGLHKGGYSTEKPRLMFTAFFSAPSFRTEKNRYHYDSKIQSWLDTLSEETQYAISSSA